MLSHGVSLMMNKKEDKDNDDEKNVCSVTTWNIIFGTTDRPNFILS